MRGEIKYLKKRGEEDKEEGIFNQSRTATIHHTPCTYCPVWVSTCDPKLIIFPLWILTACFGSKGCGFIPSSARCFPFALNLVPAIKVVDSFPLQLSVSQLLSISQFQVQDFLFVACFFLEPPAADRAPQTRVIPLRRKEGRVRAPLFGVPSIPRHALFW